MIQHHEASVEPTEQHHQMGEGLAMSGQGSPVLSPPPGSLGTGYQAAANQSHQMVQRRAAGPVNPARPVQRALPGELNDTDYAAKGSTPSVADTAAHERYTDRKETTDHEIQSTHPGGAANEVVALVFSGNFGQLGRITPPTGDFLPDPVTPLSKVRQSGNSSVASHDGEIYLIDGMNDLVDEYVAAHRKQLSPGFYGTGVDKDGFQGDVWMPNDNPLHDGIRIEIIGPQGTCTDCQAALQQWLGGLKARFDKLVRPPALKAHVPQTGGAPGSVAVSLVTRWTDGNKTQTGKRGDNRKGLSGDYGNSNATLKNGSLKGVTAPSTSASDQDGEVKEVKGSRPHYKLKFAVPDTSSSGGSGKQKKKKKRKKKKKQTPSASSGVSISLDESDHDDQEEEVKRKSFSAEQLDDWQDEDDDLDLMTIEEVAPKQSDSTSLSETGLHFRGHRQQEEMEQQASLLSPETSSPQVQAKKSPWWKCPKCYLTTACVGYRGLPDDCEELTLLRAFRDDYLFFQPHGPALIKKYYAYAPEIVQSINARSDAAAIYEEIYAVVRQCVTLIKAGEMEATFELYCRMVEQVRESYASSLLVL